MDALGARVDAGLDTNVGAGGGANASASGLASWFKFESWTWHSIVMVLGSIAILGLVAIIIVLVTRDTSVAKKGQTQGHGQTPTAHPSQPLQPQPQQQPQQPQQPQPQQQQQQQTPLFPAPPESGVEELGEQDALALFSPPSANAKTIVFAYSPGCPACVYGVRELYAATSAIKALGVRCVAVNAIQSRQFSRTHGVNSYPTFYGIKADGTVVKFAGARPSAELISFCSQLVDSSATQK